MGFKRPEVRIFSLGPKILNFVRNWGFFLPKKTPLYGLTGMRFTEQLLRFGLVAFCGQIRMDPLDLALAVFVGVQNDIVFIIFDLQASCHVKAIPHNSARANPEKIWVLMKAVFCRNTLCIARKSDKIRALIFQEAPMADYAVLP